MDIIFGTSPSPEEYQYEVDLSETNGYSDLLYFPHNDTLLNCTGYWLTAPSNQGCDVIQYVGYFGWVTEDGGSYYNQYYAFRPIIKLQTSVIIQ